MFQNILEHNFCQKLYVYFPIKGVKKLLFHQEQKLLPLHSTPPSRHPSLADIEQATPELEDTLVCMENESHQNQLAALSCKKCNPFERDYGAHY